MLRMRKVKIELAICSNILTRSIFRNEIKKAKAENTMFYSEALSTKYEIERVRLIHAKKIKSFSHPFQDKKKALLI